MTITQYLRNKEKRNSTTYVISKGEGYFIDNGKKIPEKEFDAMYPLAEKVYPDNRKFNKGESPDSRRIK